MFASHKMWLQDVTEAYIQGHILLRDIYVNPDKKLTLKEDIYLKIIKALYGLSESGDSWFEKYMYFLKK